MAGVITVDSPTARTGSSPTGSTAAELAASIGRAWPRRRWRPPSTAAEVDLERRAAPTATEVAVVTDDTEAGRDGAAPLDRPRAGPGRARPVARGPLRHRPGDRGRLLLRLRAARRGALQRRRPGADRGRDASRSSPRTSPSCARSTPSPRASRSSPTSPSSARSSTASSGRRGSERASATCRPGVGGQHLPERRRLRRPVPGPARASTGRLGPLQAACGSPAPTGAATRSAPQLQRIYGTAWESEKALAEHLHRLEEAERRDHRKLGAELDLFSLPRARSARAWPSSIPRAGSSAG